MFQVEKLISNLFFQDDYVTLDLFKFSFPNSESMRIVEGGAATSTIQFQAYPRILSEQVRKEGRHLRRLIQGYSLGEEGRVTTHTFPFYPLNGYQDSRTEMTVNPIKAGGLYLCIAWGRTTPHP